DGAPGLVNAIEQLWPEADRQRCTVHRLRNVLAKLPERERERVKAAHWRALDDADSASDRERRLRTLVGELADAGYAAAAAASPTTSKRSASTCATRSSTGASGGRRMKVSKARVPAMTWFSGDRLVAADGRRG